MRILFVCTGNVCRSPTAERLAVAIAAKSGMGGLEASSAGTKAVIGHPMHPESAAVLERLGGDASGFVARQLLPRIADSADLVLTMTRDHRNAVLELAPRKFRRTFTLREASMIASTFTPASVEELALLRTELPSTSELDILDPIGQSSDVFGSVGSQIADLLPPVLEVCYRDLNPEVV